MVAVEQLATVGRAVPQSTELGPATVRQVPIPVAPAERLQGVTVELVPPVALAQARSVVTIRIARTCLVALAEPGMVHHTVVAVVAAPVVLAVLVTNSAQSMLLPAVVEPVQDMAVMRMVMLMVVPAVLALLGLSDVAAVVDKAAVVAALQPVQAV